MIRKTYGVSGLMDWTTQIKAGKASVSVHFTGGALTAYGVTPAKYSTSNPFFQSVIENSEQFKSGRIELLGKMEVPDDEAARARKAISSSQKTSKPVSDDAASPLDTTEDSGDDGVIPAVVCNSVSSPVRVEVSDKYDAIEYLKEHYAEKNYTATSLRTKTAFEAACKECGIEFVFSC